MQCYDFKEHFKIEHFHALGCVDELNSNIGHAIAHCKAEGIEEKFLLQLRQIQSRLFDVGAHVATPRDSNKEPSTTKDKQTKTQFAEAHTKDLENWIDDITLGLPPLRNFVLPSGGLGATALHISRTVCRRCERELVPLLQEQKIDTSAYKYVNRLSDYLYTLARHAAKVTGNPEEPWVKSHI